MALSGDHVIVKMDDSSGALRTFADGDIRSIDLGLTYDQFDVTGFGDEAHQVHKRAIAGASHNSGLSDDRQIPRRHPHRDPGRVCRRQQGLVGGAGRQQRGARQPSDPKYSGEFLIASYRPQIMTGGAVMFTAALQPATGDARRIGARSRQRRLRHHRNSVRGDAQWLVTG